MNLGSGLAQRAGFHVSGHHYTGKIGLNIGSGQRPFKSNDHVWWANVDKVDREGQLVDELCDASKLPYAENTADYVVLHHVLEHFGCNEGNALLDEARRVLKPKGSLLVFVPNMAELAIAWMQGRISTQIYMTNVYGAYMGSEEDRHRWGFDRNSLKDLLSARGFFPVIPFDWRAISGADIAKDWWILGMEAVKEK